MAAPRYDQWVASGPTRPPGAVVLTAMGTGERRERRRRPGQWGCPEG